MRFTSKRMVPWATALFGRRLSGQAGSIPTYNLSWGLRTVDGSFNHLLPGQEQWGAADKKFPSLMDPVYRPADGTPFDPDGPGPAPAMPYTPGADNRSNGPANSWAFSIRPCARSPTCWSTRPWAILPRS